MLMKDATQGTAVVQGAEEHVEEQQIMQEIGDLADDHPQDNVQAPVTVARRTKRQKKEVHNNVLGVRRSDRLAGLLKVLRTRNVQKQLAL